MGQDFNGNSRRHRQRSFVEEYNLTTAQFAFVHAYAQFGYAAGKACYAVAAAKDLIYEELPPDGPGGKTSMRTQANKWLKNDEVKRYIDDRLDKSALRADITEDEVNAYLRRCVQTGLGDRSIRKTVLVTVTRVDQEGAEVESDDEPEREYVDVEVFEPNLSAAHNAAVSLGKTKGMFVDKQELTGNNNGPIDYKWTIEVIRPNAKTSNT